MLFSIFQVRDSYTLPTEQGKQMWNFKRAWYYELSTGEKFLPA
jgi:hypothetical protein